MSVVDRRGVGVDPDGDKPVQFWRSVAQQYVCGDSLKARRICVLALREIYDMPVDVIGLALGLHKGQISRMSQQARNELREALQLDEAGGDDQADR